MAITFVRRTDMHETEINNYLAVIKVVGVE